MEPTSELLSGLGARVRAFRADRGWSQRVLASEAGVSPRFLVQVEQGAGNLSLTKLGQIAAALDVSLVRLLCGLGPVHDTVDHIASLADARRLDERMRIIQQLDPPREKVALVGLRGAGKTTIGQALASELGCPFIALDRLVEQRAGMSLAEIFEFHGADRYRREGAVALRDALEAPGRVVIELGGSQIEDEETWALLRGRAHTVWLRASPEAHLARVREQGDLRPMAGRADALGELRQILIDRGPRYARAHQQIDTERAGVLGAVAEISQAIAPSADGF